MPKKWNRVAVFVGHGQLAELFGRQRRISRGRDAALFGQGETVHARRAVDDVHLRDDAGMRVVDVVGVGGELGGSDAKRADHRRRPVGVENRLFEACRQRGPWEYNPSAPGNVPK